MDLTNVPTKQLINAAKAIQARAKREQELLQVLNSLTTVDQIRKKETEWLVPYWIPKGEVTLLVGDGGIGKTSIWCRMVSEISQGKPCFLEDPDEEQFKENRVCMFFSSEDSVSAKLKEQFARYDAWEQNLCTIEPTLANMPVLRRVRIGSDELKLLIMKHRPALCVLDPIQAFLPDSINMNSRNGIRKCMEYLSTLGKTFGTAFLRVCHTNKRENTSARNRISNSADLWDAARSVIMVGITDIELENKPVIKYISNEKNNYAPLQATILFSIGEDGRIQFEGYSARHEAGFLRKSKKKAAAAPSSKVEECQDAILVLLEGAENGMIKSAALNSALQEAGYSLATVKRAKSALKKDGKIDSVRKGFAETTEFYTALKTPEDEAEQI